MLKLNPLFGDNMVLQAGKPIRIFGKGTGKITAKIVGTSVYTEAQNGAFCIELPMKNYGDTLTITISDEENEITLSNVVFGDVYLFVGQSNMEFKLSSATSDGEIYENNDVRVFVAEKINMDERFSPKDGWISLSKEVVPDISAIAYFTARELNKMNNYPIGVITAYQGASIIESWLSPEALQEINISLPNSELFPDHYMEEYSKWNKNSVLYNLDILPLTPFSLKGVIWYQGESNCGDGESKVYDKYLAKLVTSWREAFKDDKLPFVIVQIADFEGRDYPAWHEIQKRQEMVCDTLENCRLAVSRDVSETDDIHPPTKHLLSKRIAYILNGAL